MTRAQGEDGYAVVAAVAALAVFAAVAYAVLAAEAGDLADLRGQFAEARLEAAADAGLYQAIGGLAAEDPQRRWPIDGRVQGEAFDGVRLAIVVEDERGKLPFSAMTSDQFSRLLAAVGVPEDRARELVAAYDDWNDPNADPKRHQMEMAEYAARGLAPSEGGPDTIDELAQMNGMDIQTFARIKPALTQYFGESGGFDPDTASPLAIAAMSEAGANDPSVLARQKEIEGEQVAMDITPDKSMAGHAVTIDVRADDSAGGHLQRRTVVEFTGQTAPAYYLREMQ